MKAAEPPALIFSKDSTSEVPPSLWFASDFLLGAGMVIIQPETEKIVVIYDTKRKIWFLPKGRKDVGESLEQTALREAYEEVSVCSPHLSLV
jgi:8-oxo-dGTP pyrophosphatase MutT (NUDIX family)